MDGEFIDTLCQNFKEVPQTLATTETVINMLKITRPPLKIASLKDAKAVIEEGGSTIWGHLPDISHKSDKFGLGFSSMAQRDIRYARARRPPLCISNHGVNALEDRDGGNDMDSWIFPTTNGGPINWAVKDFVPITFIQK